MIEEAVTDNRLLRGSGVIVLGGLLLAINGPWGVALVAAVGLLWLTLETPTPYVVATGQLLYAVLLADPGLFGAVGVVAFMMLFIVDLVQQWGIKTAAFATVALILTTALLASSLIVDSLSIAALVMCLGFGVAAYSIHRYELVRFGLVEPNR